MVNPDIYITECPRDAMQGIPGFIPTDVKIAYINTLLEVGFEKIDFGSFVSPKAIPQMSDTPEVVSKLNSENKRSDLLVIIANERGAEEAMNQEAIDYLGFPFSVSETFQIKNTNATLDNAIKRISYIQRLCLQNNKKLLVYLSMGFGNPYGDPWHPELVLHWVEQLNNIGIHHIALADTIGISNPENIGLLFKLLVLEKPGINFIAHLHSQPGSAKEKIHAAYENGCRHFDSAIRGLGGCPMAKDELTGNIATETLFEFITENKLEHPYDMHAFQHALSFSEKVF